MKNRKQPIPRHAKKSVAREGSAMAKPAVQPVELMSAMLKLIALLKVYMPARESAPLVTALAGCVPLFLKECFRTFGIPMEYEKWREGFDNETPPPGIGYEMFTILGQAWSNPDYPEKTGAYWPPPRMNAHEARRWPEQIFVLSQYKTLTDDPFEWTVCRDIINCMERCYTQRLRAGSQRPEPRPRH
jgi:hypothetical protein